MTILLTGASGFIGRQLCIRLLKEGLPFICLVRTSTDRSFFEQNQIKCITFRPQDIALADEFRSHKISGVVHLASMFLAEHSRADIDNLITSNILFGAHILEACINENVRWFLNTGTFWQHYKGSNYDPVNLYAATKQAFEDIGKFYVEAHGLRFFTLKLCDTYGPEDTRKKIFSLFQKNAADGKILEMSAGEQLIDIVHVDQVVSTFIKLIYQISKPTKIKDNFESYYITSGRKISLKELAAEYERDNNVKLNIKWGSRPYRVREVMNPSCRGIRIDMSSPSLD